MKKRTIPIVLGAVLMTAVLHASALEASKEPEPVQAPRSEQEAPRGEQQIQALRGEQEVQAPRSEQEAPRGQQEVQAPRVQQEIQAVVTPATR